jgi:hypothetical protein
MTQGKWDRLSSEQRIDMWRRWKAGESLHEMGCAFGKDHGSIQFLLSQRRGIVPAARRHSLRTLTLAEREDISRGIASGSSIRGIAKGLQRAASTVSREVAAQLDKLGPLTRHEMILAGIVVLSLALWVTAGAYVGATTVALIAVSLMLITQVLTWNDIAEHKRAWTTLAWLGALIALCDGLNCVGFVKWFADGIATHTHGFSSHLAMIILLAIFFLAHYLRQCGCVHDSATAGHSGHWRCHSRNSLKGICPAAVHGIGNHGGHHAIRECGQPDLCQQRLPAGEGLLASRNDFRRRLPHRVPQHRRALGILALAKVSGP